MTDYLEYLRETAIGLSGGSSTALALIMSLLAAALTTLGSLPVLLIKYKKEDPKSLEFMLDVGLGFSSGVMIVASFTSLLLPSIEGGGILMALVGFLGGAVVIAIINELLPHEHLFKGFEGWVSARKKIRAAWLVALAILIHNLPEGYSIGVASAYDLYEGFKLGLAIGLQDVPEGLAIALPVLGITGSRSLAIFAASLSGLSETLTALIAVTVFSGLPFILYLGLSSAAGAMVYVVVHEALPESHGSGREKYATLGFFIGFIAMIYLDTALG